MLALNYQSLFLQGDACVSVCMRMHFWFWDVFIFLILSNLIRQRMEDVLCAAVNDIFSGTTTIFANSKVTYDKTPQDRMEHLLGLMMACVQHELHSLLDRGNPARLKQVFADIAKEWRSSLNPAWIRQCIISVMAFETLRTKILQGILVHVEKYWQNSLWRCDQV